MQLIDILQNIILTVVHHFYFHLQILAIRSVPSYEKYEGTYRIADTEKKHSRRR